MAVSKKAKQIYNAIFDGTETWVANTIQKIQEHILLKKTSPKEAVPFKYAKKYKEYWKKYGFFSPKWGWFYAARNCNMDVRYIPHTLYYTKIDQHFNSRKLGWGFNDKNYYSRIFAGIPQAKVFARNIGGVFLNEDYSTIDKEHIFDLVAGQTEVICKPALETGSGRGIQFWQLPKDLPLMKAFLDDEQSRDYLIQEVIKQHRELKKIHEASVNSIRICSLLIDGKVEILSSCLRMGDGGNRVDNHHAGGVSAGINTDGTLQKYAYYLDGRRLQKHSQGFVFEGFSVPGYHKAVAMVKKAHPIVSHFRLVGWDIAVCEDGEPILIECNMRKNGIELHQFSNGPLFGDLTERILNEVFNRK